MGMFSSGGVGKFMLSGKSPYSYSQEGNTDVAPWGEQQPYLKDIFSRAKTLSNTPMQYYGGDTIANFTPEQTWAQDWTTNRALLGSPLTSASKNTILDTVSGKYLTPDSNPYLSYYYNKAAEEALPSIDSNAVKAGRYGGSAWGLMKGKTMADLAGNIYGGAYNTERDRQLQASQYAPELAKNDYYDIGKLAAVGEEKQAMSQADIDAAKEKFEFNQLEPWQRLGMYSDLTSGNFGGTTDSTSSRLK